MEKGIIQNPQLLKGKKGLILGVANNLSLGWAIAKEARAYGAELAFTYQSDALQKRVVPLAKELGSSLTFLCDVSREEEVAKTFNQLEKLWGTLDFVVHSIAFSDKEELRGRYIDTSRANFVNTLDISCYSLTLVAKMAERLMNPGGSLLTLTYYGAEKYIPHYNVMGVAKAALEASLRYLAVDLGEKGVRINAISAGPLKTLASSGIGDFRYILKWNQYNSPLRRNTTLEDVGKTGVYLLSPLSDGVTGEVIHVDCGYHAIGMKLVDAPDISKAL